ncbi:developmentally-regulated protein [Acrasis kona]|uniref:Developmentally-regulated protein n=1 Tax=Acrasis kona TaxID=1008807 RepID=A0AAW2YZE3_9EUKA
MAGTHDEQKDQTVRQYLHDMSNLTTFGSQAEILAAAKAYKATVMVYINGKSHGRGHKIKIYVYKNDDKKPTECKLDEAPKNIDQLKGMIISYLKRDDIREWEDREELVDFDAKHVKLNKSVAKDPNGKSFTIKSKWSFE